MSCTILFMFKKHLRHVASCLLLLVPLHGAFAAPIIRDEEIESVIRQLAVPVFKQARLNAKNIRIILINDADINAYVSGGMNIFINTGLLELSETPDTLLGVIAHETGHIAGGHLARQGEEIQRAQRQLALGYILGIATAVGGSPDAGQAIALGSSHVTERQMLSFSRKQEESADQFALSVMDKLQYSPQGLVSLLEELNNNESLQLGKANPYALTHPLSRERISHIRDHLEHSSIHYTPFPGTLAANYHAAIVKLKAYLDPPHKTLGAYPESDTSAVARMARAVAYSRIPNYPKSLANVDSLIATHPNNPYYHELRGQILYEGGRISDALPSYQKALDLKPGSDLLRIQVAITQIATQDDHFLPNAIKSLNHIVQREPENALAWRQLATAYGRQKAMGMSYLALAEEAAILGQRDETKKFADLAIANLPKGSPAALRAKDIRVISAKKR